MPKDNTQNLILMKMSIKSIRDKLNLELDALTAEVNNLIPQKRRRRKKITNWKGYLTRKQ